MMRAAGVPLETLGPAARAHIADRVAAGAIALGPDSPLRTAGKKRATSQGRESAEQRALIAWRDRVVDRIPDLRWLAAWPNGGKRGKAAAGKLKAEGVQPGPPDLWLPVSRRVGGAIAAHNAPGCVLEMKDEGRHPTPEQVEWLRHLREEGWVTHVCYSAAEARAALSAYLGVADPEPETLTTEAP